MEPSRMSPMQQRQRERSHKHNSVSPYNTDRTAGIKARSSVATQTDSFQDHLGEISELVHIDSFQDPSYLAEADNSEEFRKLVHFDSFQDPSQMVTFDFFQDHSEEKRKLLQIDSFQDHHSGLYGNLSEIDSFLDPMFVYSIKLFKLTHFKTPVHSMGNDPQTTVLNLHGRLPSSKLVISR